MQVKRSKFQNHLLFNKNAFYIASILSRSSHTFVFWFLVDSYQKTKISAIKIVDFSKNKQILISKNKNRTIRIMYLKRRKDKKPKLPKWNEQDIIHKTFILKLLLARVELYSRWLSDNCYFCKQNYTYFVL